MVPAVPLAPVAAEHVFVLSPEIQENYPGTWDEEFRVAQAIDRLTELKAHGIGTIVDLTVIGLGRYIPRIQRISEQVDINIIVATGLYTYNDVPHYFHFRGPGTVVGGPEVMIDMFVRDIEEGIAGGGRQSAGGRLAAVSRRRSTVRDACAA